MRLTANNRNIPGAVTVTSAGVFRRVKSRGGYTRNPSAVSTPCKMKTRVFTPPRGYGKIDVADFDPENYKRPSKSGGSR